MKRVLKIILKSGKDDALKRYHPWVFSGAIKKMEGPVYDGCYTEIFSNKYEYLGCGVYQDASIAVRIMAFAPERSVGFDTGFWKQKIAAAYQLRQQCGLTDNQHTNAYRLVHGEGDHLPGLIIDHYNGHIVIQIHATGLYGYIEHIASAIREIYGSRLKSIYDKSADTLPASFWAEKHTAGFLHGEAAEAEILENGNRFLVDVVEGQKTGFFIDQRDNRQLLAHYARGRKVLNTFSYTGGFSVYALKAGAAEVHSVDSSARACELTDKNILLNQSTDEGHKSFATDAMEYLRQCKDENYDLIVLDPPAYAKHQHVKHNAVQGYKRLNLEALRAIKPGGILFTFSCSQVIDMNLFRSTVLAAAILAGRQIRILHQMTQGADHPVNIFHPEGQYLKGLALMIND